MRYVFAATALFAWSLWLGGMIGLFLFVQVLFKSDRAIAVEAAPRMFLAFQTFQLIVAAVALISVTAWRLTVRRRVITGIFAMFTLAAIGAVLLSLLIMPPMEKLRREGNSGSPEFRQLHGRSMALFTAEALALLVAGLLVPAAMRADASLHLAEEPAPHASEVVPAQSA
jgi:hypothetical protein